MVSWINPKIVIKSTNNRGSGSFVNSVISQGEVVIVQGGKIMDYKTIEESEYKPFCDHCFQIEKDLLICPIEPIKERLDGVFRVNHSCNPTCGFLGQVVLIAMRNISIGEEVTYDYAMTDANWQNVTCTEMMCFCGAESCRGVITGEDWKLQALQRKYKGFFSTYIQRMIDLLHDEKVNYLEN